MNNPRITFGTEARASIDHRRITSLLTPRFDYTTQLVPIKEALEGYKSPMGEIELLGDDD